MNPQRAAALDLADFFLAGEASQEAMVRGAIRAFGREWPWMAGLCRRVRRRAGEYFHDFSRDEMAVMILDYTAFAKAWAGEGERPRVVSYCLEAPPARVPPGWLFPVALPELRNAVELAAWLEVSPDELAWFADRWRDQGSADSPLRHYRYRWVAKNSGGLRLIEIPKARLCAMQRRILGGILNLVRPHEAVHGFRRGRSCVTHAARHAGKSVVLRMDLKDFFPSIGAARIHALFARLGYSDSVARLLTGVCTHRTPSDVLSPPGVRRAVGFAARQAFRSRHLPQGAPTSPALANLCAFRLDLRLDALARSLGATYTRYADDLAFSGAKAFAAATQRFHVQVAAIALEEGFAVNTRKTRIMGSGGRQRITGMVVNRHPNLQRREFDTLKAMLTNCLRHGPETQNREGRADFRAHLQGKVAYAAMVNPARGERLKELLGRIAWPENPI